jgi:hypothetical protein
MDSVMLLCSGIEAATMIRAAVPRGEDLAAQLG